MSLTSEYQDRGEGEAAADEEVASEGDEQPTSGADERSVRNFICVVCQQPLAEQTSQRWQGEPVHPECGAELRCGVSVGASYDD